VRLKTLEIMSLVSAANPNPKKCQHIKMWKIKIVNSNMATKMVNNQKRAESKDLLTHISLLPLVCSCQFMHIAIIACYFNLTI
jgi:hypothetical protein